MIKKANVQIPFDYCKECEMLSIKEDVIYSYNTPYVLNRRCANEDICVNFAKLAGIEK